MGAETESTSTPKAQQQQQSLTSRLPPIKPVQAGSLPSASVSSLMKLTMQRRAYKMPSCMKLPYTTTSDNSNAATKFLSSEASLASLLASRRSHLRSLQYIHSTELPFLPFCTRRVSFCPLEDCHESNETSQTKPQHERLSSSEEEEPPAKRRRFQRRNSKTPAMLMHSLAAAADIVRSSDFTSSSSSHNDLDGSLEIAQDLVRQLRLRRKQVQKQDDAVSS